MKNLKITFLYLAIITGASLLSAYDSIAKSSSNTQPEMTKSDVKKIIPADDVKDSESLKAFVLSAKEYLETDYETAVHDFKIKKEWRSGTIYLYGITLEGKSLFYPNDPKIEGTDLLQNPQARDGAMMALEAVKQGGGFISYMWDNPNIEGEDYTSIKLSYVTLFEKDEMNYILGSGIYMTE